MEKSIITNQEDICFVCGKPRECMHHVFYGVANRKLSDKYKLVIPLCNYHHNMSNEGIHFDSRLDLIVKQIAQKEFEKRYGHKKFMEIFGRNWL